MVDQILRSLDGRFESMQADEVLSSACIIDVWKWPLEDQTSLAAFGCRELEVLCNHFNDVLTANGCDVATARHVEWPDLKQYVKESVPRQQWGHIWQDILSDPVCADSFPNLLHIIEVIQVLPLSTAACERGFSLMKRTKTDWRSQLTVEMLKKLMSISVHGPSIDSYNPTSAVARWLKDGNRYVVNRS